MGEQDSHLPKRPSWVHLSTWPHRHILTWSTVKCCRPVDCTIICCHTIMEENWPSPFPLLCKLCARNAQTTLGEILPVFAYRRPAGFWGCTVHTRPPRSGVHGLPDPIHLRCLALSWNLRGVFQGLCESLAQDQARSQWLDRLGGRWWDQATAIHLRVWWEGGVSFGVWQDRIQARAAHPGQDDFESHVGEVRTAPQQDPSLGIRRPRAVSQVPGQRQVWRAVRGSAQQLSRGSPLPARSRGRSRLTQFEHLCGLLHDLLGPTSLVRSIGAVGGASAVFLHPLLGYQTLSSGISSETSPMIWMIWHHHGICVRKPQELWVQDPWWESGM